MDESWLRQATYCLSAPAAATRAATPACIGNWEYSITLNFLLISFLQFGKKTKQLSTRRVSVWHFYVWDAHAQFWNRLENVAPLLDDSFQLKTTKLRDVLL